MPRSLDDLISRADELAEVFEAYEPREDDAGEPPLLAPRRAAYRRALIERELAETVIAARGARPFIDRSLHRTADGFARHTGRFVLNGEEWRPTIEPTAGAVTDAGLEVIRVGEPVVFIQTGLTADRDQGTGT
jgi:hypothetical protein